LAELSEMATADLANLSNFLNPVSRGVAQPPKLSVPNAALPGPHVSQSSVSRIANEPTKARVGSNLQQIATAGIYRLWVRAPLLVISLAYSAVGLVGAGVFAAGNLVVSASAFAVFGEVLLGLWACGFLSMVGFGMYCRVKYMPPLRN
jgi:hypothetical protein